jgi:hypothetical protein
MTTKRDGDSLFLLDQIRCDVCRCAKRAV